MVHNVRAHPVIEHKVCNKFLYLFAGRLAKAHAIRELEQRVGICFISVNGVHLGCALTGVAGGLHTSNGAFTCATC